MKSLRPVAILLSDVHLSHTPPTARSNEPNWYTALARQWEWLKELQKEKNNVPIIVAGDVFDRWNSIPELINFGLTTLPTVYGIAGQHDLPFHSYSEIEKSAYFTLVSAGVINNLAPNSVSIIEGDISLRLHGFPFGFPLQPNSLPPSDSVIDIAVIHDYCWEAGHSYPGAPVAKNTDSHIKAGSGYNILHIGDNHRGYVKKSGTQWIFNGGTFYRRTIDEIDYRPMVGLVYEDGSIQPYWIPIDKDIITDRVQSVSVENVEIGDFVNYLSGIALNCLDIAEVMKQYTLVHDIPDPVKTEITRLLESTRG